MSSNKFLFILLIFFGFSVGQAQIRSLSDSLKIEFLSGGSIKIKQQSIIINQKQNKSDTIFFYAWLNAYSHKRTPLAKRFLENYDMNFHFAGKNKLGAFEIDSIFINNKKVEAFFLKNQPDIFAITSTLPAGDTIKFCAFYKIKLPNKKFTGIGIDKNGNILLKNFYLNPLPYSTQKYSNLNLDDQPEFFRKIFIELENIPSTKKVYSNLSIQNHKLYAKQANKTILLITDKKYEKFYHNNLTIILPAQKIIPFEKKQIYINKVLGFHENLLGQYPENKILITSNDFLKNPIYDAGLMPSFINPFSKELRYELNLLHQIGIQFAQKMQIDKRKYPWMYFIVSSYPELAYLEKYYPDLNLLGKFSHYKLLRYYYFSQLKILDKYPGYYLYMARMNKDQKLNTSMDKLANFNLDVASPAKMSLGLNMLAKQQPEKFNFNLKKLYQQSVTHETLPKDFFKIFHLKKNHWMMTYLTSRKKYDYKLKKISKNDSTLQLKIINKTDGEIPLEIIGIKNNKIVYRQMSNPIKNDSAISIKDSLSMDWVGINYFNHFPELQNRNNFKRLKKGILGKPLQIRLFQDAENPLKNQIFVNPFFEYNYYDGIILGTQIYNAKILHNHWNYFISPGYSTKANTLSGSVSFNYRQYFENMKPYGVKYGFSGSYYHYNHSLIYKKFNPYVDIQFRSKNIRKRKGSDAIINYLFITKENFPGSIAEQNKYGILNLRFQNFNVNILKDKFSEIDLQLSQKFGKISGKYRFRWLTDKTRQWDFRFYAGIFLYNQTQTDYFSFALDRPTDYLFRYNYYGRSESSGIFHQQFIWAEGGFKTFFPDQYANQWIIANNLNIGIWKWFNLYGDWAFKKNKGEKAGFYYDSGLRINLVQDYFEIFFPVYSSLGNELKAPEYYKKIRLVFTIDLQRLFKMYSRGWY